MEPIISPWIFYWIDVARGLIVVGATMAALTTIGILIYLCTTGGNWPPQKVIAFSACCWIITIFTPPPSTIYKMLAASYITPDNINMTVETAGKIADTISERVDRAADSLVDKIKKAKE